MSLTEPAGDPGPADPGAPSSATPPGSRRERIVDGVRTLIPGYFALVMATGIISVSMQKHNSSVVSVPLLWLAVVCYVVLVVLYVVRLVAFRGDMAADLSDPARAFGFFTFIAATDVLGSRLESDQHRNVAIVLLIVAWVAWMVLGYVVPWTAALGHARRPVLQYANGTWFIWMVASQSVAVLAASLQPHSGRLEDAYTLLAIFSWAIGVFLYAAAGIYVGARMLVYPLRPADLTPPYWVSMGATAITVLAGVKIVQMTKTPAIAAPRGLIAGAVLLFWTFGTWLIPVLIAAEIWRHVVHHIPLGYEPQLWSVVFPIGMYGVACQFLGDLDHLTIIDHIGAYESWVALGIWALVFAGMLHHLARTLFRSQPARHQPN